MGRLFSVQYLRAFAAFGVVVFHAQSFTYGRALVIGSAGVDVFFVISGFVMWTVTAYRAQTPGDFLLNRIVRIVPMYWFVTLAFVFTAIIFPVLFLEKTRRLFFLAAAFFAVVLAGLIYTGNSPSIIFFSDPIVLEFLAGVLLGRAFEQDLLPQPRWGYVSLAAGLLLFLAAALFAIESPRVVVWGIPAFLLVAGAVTIEKNRNVPVIPALVVLGDASYSIYLTHTLSISAIAKVKVYFNPASFFVTSLVLSALIGVAAWRLIERPFAEFMKPRSRVEKPHLAE